MMPTWLAVMLVVAAFFAGRAVAYARMSRELRELEELATRLLSLIEKKAHDAQPPAP